jgi:O-antigen/teichoic acid export membrane protein
MTGLGTTPQLQVNFDGKPSEATKGGRWKPSAIGAGGAQMSITTRFARDVFVLGWANVASLVSNGVLSFLLPRYLTIEDFGYYRLFLLYASFAGVAHLGMLEGILVRWAEQPEDRVGDEICSVFRFLLVQQAVLLVPLCVALLWVHKGKWLWAGSALALYVLVCNISMLGQIALQARRQFSQLSFATVLTSITFFSLILASKLLGRLDARLAITSYVVANVLAGIAIGKMALESGSAPAQSLRCVLKQGLQNTRVGWRLLLANVIVAFTPSLDRFFVSGVFSIRSFAIYAFAGNALAIIYTVTMSTAQVVYPYLSSGTSSDSRRWAYAHGRSLILGLWAISQLLYFPTAYLVHWILPTYVASLPVVRLLMMSSGFIAMINILQVNYFRVTLALNGFLKGSLVGLFAVGALLAMVSHKASLLWIAAGMVGGILVWWVSNEVLLARELRTPQIGWVRTLVLWALCSAVFWGACAIKGLLLGGFVYALGCSVLLAFGIAKTMSLFFAETFKSASHVETGS